MNSGSSRMPSGDQDDGDDQDNGNDQGDGDGDEQSGSNDEWGYLGYILCSPLTDKFMDFNARVEFAHPAVENCRGNYVNTAKANSLCIDSHQRYEECTSGIDLKNILDPVCDKTDPKPPCQIGQTIRLCNKLLTFVSGDHDMTFPYVGVEQWIAALNLGLDSPWEPFYIDAQVGGYEMTYAHNDFYMTYATIKGAGHSVAQYKPKEAMVLLKKLLATQAYTCTM
ncbi:serine carboxypeptidase-like 16 [Artemisia annua]|uniref:Serine carboxypeptidase-like 16 n=1 Tax=Artemisia annua TaxID=35608 RepID=A0A2U1QHV6_ARTAN|nr:serine carboxypeptidase-like 16 [Artemisia annua]